MTWIWISLPLVRSSEVCQDLFYSYNEVDFKWELESEVDKNTEQFLI